MTTLTEGSHAGEFVVSEANGNRSRETETVANGQNLAAAAVVGKITVGGEITELAPAAGDGSEAASGILFAAVDASAAAARGAVMVRDCEVNAAEIIWPAGITAPQQATATAELEALGILLR